MRLPPMPPHWFTSARIRRGREANWGWRNEVESFDRRVGIAATRSRFRNEQWVDLFSRLVHDLFERSIGIATTIYRRLDESLRAKEAWSLLSIFISPRIPCSLEFKEPGSSRGKEEGREEKVGEMDDSRWDYYSGRPCSQRSDLPPSLPSPFSLYQVSFCLLLSWISIGKTLDHKNLLFSSSFPPLPIRRDVGDKTSGKIVGEIRSVD